MSNWNQTPRGFFYVEIPFQDYRHSTERRLSIQESSLASEDKLWVGVDTVYADLSGDGELTLMERSHLGVPEVTALRDALNEWLESRV